VAPLVAGTLYDVAIPLPFLAGGAFAVAAAALMAARRRAGAA
jgi:hypothetical protein